MNLTLIYNFESEISPRYKNLLANACIITEKLILETDNNILNTENEFKTVLGFKNIRHKLNDKCFINTHKERILELNYNKIKNELTIRSDRFGGVEFYYFYDNTLFFASTHFEKLLKIIPIHAKKLDWLSASELIDYGYVLYDKTLVERVRRFPYGTHMTITHNGIENLRYWNFKLNDDLGKTSNRKQCVSDIGELLKSSVKECIPNDKNIAIPISGGLDSRLIITAAADQIEIDRIKAFTTGQLKTQDLNIAKKLTNYLGINHTLDILPPDSDPSLNKIDWTKEYNSRLNENSGTIDATPFASDVNIYKNTIFKDTDFSFSGYMGDPLFGSHLTKDMLTFRKNEYDTFENIHDTQKIHFFGNVLRKHLSSFVPENIREELKTYKTEAALKMHWDFAVRQQNYIKQGQIFKYRNNVNVYTPFLHPDLFEYVSSNIPLNEKLGEKIYFESLIKIYPNEFGNISSTFFQGNKPDTPLLIKLAKSAMLKTNGLINKQLLPVNRKLNYRDYKIVASKHSNFRRFLSMNLDKLEDIGVIETETKKRLDHSLVNLNKEVALICRLATLNQAIEKFKIKV
jgi:hypothetical protein